MRLMKLRQLVLLIAAGGALAAFAQTVPENPPLVIRSVLGRDLFEFYCATCHGRDGKGNGATTAALTVRPPDLTRIARRNGGVFPSARVEAFVAFGRDVAAPSHGKADMPVWGPVFRGLDPSDTRVKIRIANLVKYIESIQEK
jgi:mono/diheme cytochrome c family protein